MAKTTTTFNWVKGVLYVGDSDDDVFTTLCSLKEFRDIKDAWRVLSAAGCTVDELTQDLSVGVVA